MSVYEPVKHQTEELEQAVYAALDACDDYERTIREGIEAELVRPEPRETVVKRLRQFEKKVQTMTAVIEDDVITEMLHLLDRLAMLKRAEDGTFI